MPKPKAPRWTARGDFPREIIPETATDEQMDLLDEDMLQMVDPTGIYTLDVGWYPAGTRSGRFVCRVVRWEDWDRPLDQVETSDTKIVWRWLKQQIDEVNLRVGQTGMFTDKVGLFIQPNVAKTSRAKKRRPAAPRLKVIQTFLTSISPPALVDRLFSGQLPAPTTTNPSTSAPMAVRLGSGLPLANAA